MDQINWVLVFLVGNFGLSLFNSISNRHKVAQDELAAVRSGLKQELELLANKIASHGEKLSGLESEIREKPTHDHLGEIYKEIRDVSKAVGGLNSNISEISGKLSEVSRLLDRMDTFWRDHDRGN